MLRNFISLLIVTIAISCDNGNREVRFINRYSGTIDSLVFRVNSKPIFKVEKITWGIDTLMVFSKSGLVKNKDVFITASLYNNGQLSDSFFSANDYSVIPKKTEIIITDSLKLSINVTYK